MLCHILVTLAKKFIKKYNEGERRSKMCDVSSVRLVVLLNVCFQRHREMKWKEILNLKTLLIENIFLYFNVFIFEALMESFYPNKYRCCDEKIYWSWSIISDYFQIFMKISVFLIFRFLVFNTVFVFIVCHEKLVYFFHFCSLKIMALRFSYMVFWDKYDWYWD